GLWQNERSDLIEALRLRGDLLPARLALARNYITANEPKIALQVLDEAPASQQHLLPILLERNWALLAEGDLVALHTALAKGLHGGRYLGLVVQEALLHMAKQDYTAAIA